MKVKEKHNQKLLVEGNDDQHIIWALLQHHTIRESFDVIEDNGYPNLLTLLQGQLKTSGDVIRTIGIVVDADTDIRSRWQSIGFVLKKAGCILPPDPPSDGYISTTQPPLIKRIGVWVMPNNVLPGMIEDFVSMLIPRNDTLLQPCNEFLNNLEGQQLHRYGQHRSKALIHTWLAVQENPGTPMGLAITKKYLSTDHEICLRFIQWLDTLFNEQP